MRSHLEEILHSYLDISGLAVYNPGELASSIRHHVQLESFIMFWFTGPAVAATLAVDDLVILSSTVGD